MEIYKEAKLNKNYGQVDVLRGHFKALGLVVKDMKTGIDWAYDEI